MRTKQNNNKSPQADSLVWGYHASIYTIKERRIVAHEQERQSRSGHFWKVSIVKEGENPLYNPQFTIILVIYYMLYFYEV